MKKNGRKAKAPAAGVGEMVIRCCGEGERVSYPGAMHSSKQVRWVSRARTASGLPAEIRDPQEKTRAFFVGQGFVAAGKRYTDLGQLFVQRDETATWCKDIYGRQVLYLAKRFPCFDCFDAVHEHRFYRWFFLKEGSALTRVYFADEGRAVYVTEDVRNLETYCWDELERVGYFQ